MVFLEEGRLIFSHNILEYFLDSKEQYFPWVAADPAGGSGRCVWAEAPAPAVLPPLANLLSCNGSEEYFYKYLLPANLK